MQMTIFLKLDGRTTQNVYNYVSSLHAKSYFDPIVRKKIMTGFIHPTSTCLSEYNYSLVTVIHPISPDADR